MKTKRILATASAIALTLLTGVVQSHATQTVRELFDGLNAGHDFSTIDGLTNQDVTTVGLRGGWETFPKGYDSTGTNWVSCTNIVYKDTFTVNWPLGDLDYYNGGLILTSGGANGCLNANLGGLNIVTDTNTASPFGQWTSQAYATHPLGSSAGIDFQASGTYYFSVRIVKSYQWAPGDSSAGVGFSTGNGPGDRFVGIGVTRPDCLLADGTTEIGDTTYISTGTLGQAGISSHPDDTGGPYLPVVYGTVGLWTNQAAGTDQYRTTAFLVGKLTTTPSGASTLSVKTYLPFCPVYTNGVLFGKTTNYDGTPITLEQDINNPAWEATYSFTETSVMTNLLVWMHGSTLEYDAVRVGTTYGDVVGLEFIGAPVASPASTIYAGTTVTFSENAALNGSVPMAFQWLSNSVPLLNQTNSTLVLTSPDTSATADYSVFVANVYGAYTGAVTHLTVNPAVAPFFTAKPVSITRYVGSPAATFTASVDGTPPFTYQWQHAGTNISSATITANQNNTLVLPPITLADAGNYSLIVTNAFGSTNSAVPGPVATLTETVPPTNSYAAAVTAIAANLYGYWRLDDSATTNNPKVYDNWGNNNGAAVVNDIGNMTFGVAGAPFVGFTNPHLGTFIGNQWWAAPYRLNLPKLPYYTNSMTFTMWVNGGCQFVNHNGYNAGWGLENNAGSLQFDWRGRDPNGQANITWNSGLSVPANTWTFVALVVEPTQATVYVGADRFSLTSASSGPLATANGAFTNSDSTTIGDTQYLYPFGVGRNQWPWAEDGNGSQWASSSGTWSDVAIYYQSLTSQQITNMYVAGVGYQLQGAPDGAGNLVLNWLDGVGSVLQQANNVEGPYTDIGSATPPYSVVIPTTGNKFYRIKH